MHSIFTDLFTTVGRDTGSLSPSGQFLVDTAIPVAEGEDDDDDVEDSVEEEDIGCDVVAEVPTLAPLILTAAWRSETKKASADRTRSGPAGSIVSGSEPELAMVSMDA